MGKRAKRIHKQYKKHREEGESKKDFMIRLNGNTRPEQQRLPSVSSTGLAVLAGAAPGVAAAARAAEERSARAARTAQEAPEPTNEAQTEAPAPAAPQEAVNPLTSYTVERLRARAKQHGIKGYSSMRKADLVRALGSGE